MTDKKPLAAATGSSLAARLQDKASALVQSGAATGGSAMGGVAYMRFSKFGEYTYGPDHIQTEDGARWAINLDSCVHGWQAWTDDGKPAGDLMVSAFEPLPLESELPDSDGSWNKAVGFMLACVSGEDKGTVCLFKSNSMGGRDAYRDLINTAVTHLQENPADVVPIVELTNSFYIHDKYGKIFKPVFEIVDYGQEDLLQDPNAEVAAAPEPEAEPEPAPEKPKRTRTSRRQRVS